MEYAHLARLLDEQRREFLQKEPGISREVNWRSLVSLGRVLTVTGIRRCGKSTLLRQIAEEYGDSFIYLSFDDLRLSSFSNDDYGTLLSLFSKTGPGNIILFDEIQMAPEWERFLRRLHDMGRTIVVTGSNSSILTDELGTHLTGRYLKQELFPFSFSEYLSFAGIDHGSIDSAEDIPRIMDASLSFLNTGGFPEYLKHQTRELLDHLFKDVLARDIIARHGIQERSSLQDLAIYLMSNQGSKVSYGKLAGNIGFKSATSVKEYMACMEDVYLLFQLRRFDWSVKRSMLSPRKVYPVDNGLSASVAFRPTPETGRNLETAVFLHLRRLGMVWYFAGRGECDFITRTEKGYDCIQVCWHLNEENRERELNGLLEAARSLDEETGTIVTIDQESTIEPEPGFTVKVIPFWRWALMNRTEKGRPAE
ncbi:MAG TPA: ATP-binding protein [Candidatus Sabulitectum sp.]|nr:ATP-binding protein [Candidatus Sabulitectum sp.]